MEEFKPQDDKFDLRKFLSGTARPFTYKFYCPSCSEKVEMHLIIKTEDDTFECPSCNGIMLLEEDNDKESTS